MNTYEPGLLTKKRGNLITQIKELQGDPQYLSRGMAIGIFVGFTPTIPFHTILAVMLAIFFRGSKSAAAIPAYFLMVKIFTAYSDARKRRRSLL